MTRTSRFLRAVATVAATMGLALGLGYGAMAAQKKTVEQRVTDLESKVLELETQLRAVRADLARTPKLGMQTAR